MTLTQIYDVYLRCNLTAILAFIGAFFLIRYKFKEARHDEIKAEGGVSPVPSIDGASNQPIAAIWSADPHIEQVGPFRRGNPPTHLLDRCHSVCMGLAATGFVLALIGVMFFVWARLPWSSGIFASGCMAVCFGIGAVGLFSRVLQREAVHILV